MFFLFSVQNIVLYLKIFFFDEDQVFYKLNIILSAENVNELLFYNDVTFVDILVFGM